MKPTTDEIRDHWALDHTRQLDTCRDGCWHKHQACLLAMLCDRVDELNVAAHELAGEVALLKAEKEVLRGALQQYADADNWGVLVWIGPGDSGPDVAREALEDGERAP